jgi:hypothetical protein
MALCDEVPNLTIGGHIETAFGEPVDLVYTTLEGGMSAEYMTAADGDYYFDHIPMMQEYQITPSRNDDPKNGVTTLDLILIQKHLLGLQPFNEPYAFIAADINRSETVSALDLIELRKLILGIYTEFPNNTSWRFIDAQTVFADPDHPFDFTGSVSTGILSDHATLDFTAVKIGDLNGTVHANATQVTTRAALRQWSFKAQDQEVRRGQKIDLTFELVNPNQLLGFQGFIELDGLTFDGVQSSLSDLTNEHVAINANGVGLSWSRGSTPESGTEANAVFTIRLIAQRDGLVSEMVHLNPDKIVPEVYGATHAGGIETYRLGLVFKEVKQVDAGLPFALYQNIPNPWHDETLIKFDLPSAMHYSLTIYDVMGQPRQVKSGSGVPGSNYVIINSGAFPGDEVLYFSLVAEDYTAVRKMILSQ